MRESIPVGEMLVQLQNGQDEVIEILYPRFRRAFYINGRRHGLTHEDAEDAVGNAFESILRKIQTCDLNKGSGEAWMWTIFRNEVIDFHRFHPAGELPPNTRYRGVEGNPEEWTERDELDQCLEAAWNTLSEPV